MWFSVAIIVCDPAAGGGLELSQLQQRFRSKGKFLMYDVGGENGQRQLISGVKMTVSKSWISEPAPVPEGERLVEIALCFGRGRFGFRDRTHQQEVGVGFPSFERFVRDPLGTNGFP